MEISVVVKSLKSKDGRTFSAASARGKYLKGVDKVEAEALYYVKMPKSECRTWPVAEGVYSVVCGEAWIDKRSTDASKVKTVWIKSVSSIVFKAPLKEKAPKDDKVPF